MRTEPSTTPRRRARQALAAGAAAGALALVAGAAALWTQRNAVASRLVVDALARRGVPAAVRITRLDPQGAEGSLTVGPAGEPDLVVPHFRVNLAAWPPPGGGSPRITAVLLDHPRLRARWDGRRLTFGSLQPAVEAALRAQPGGPPAPDMTVRNGLLSLATPAGPAQLLGDAQLRAGRLASAHAELTAAAAAQAGVRVSALAGRIDAEAGGDRLALRVDLAAAAARSAGGGAQAPRLQVTADLPYGRDAQDPFDGHVTADAALSVAHAQANSLQMGRARLDAHFDGVLARGGEHVVGGADVAFTAAEVSAAQGALRGVRARLAAYGVDAAATRRAPVARSPVLVEVAAAGGEARLGRERLRLDALRLRGQGRAVLHPTLQFHGEVGGSAHAGLGAPAAARLAAALVPAGWADLRVALARSLGGFALQAPRLAVAGGGRDWRVALPAPASLAADAGARLTVADAAWNGGGRRGSGRFAATLAGGGLPQVRLAAPVVRVSAGAVRVAGATVAVAGSAGPLRDAHLAVHGDMQARAGRLTLRAARCEAATLGAYLGEDATPVAQAISARLCPTGAPLLDVGPAGWRVAFRAPSLTAEAPAAKLSIPAAAGAMRMSGDRRGWTGELQLATARVRDTASPLRFTPLLAHGDVRLSQEGADAELALTLARPQRPLGALRVLQRFDTGAGALTLETPELAFAPDGLQPAMIAPALASVGSEAKGGASAELHLGWSRAGASSSARVRVADLDFRSPAGPVKGLATDLAITSLDPLTTAPDQHVRVRELQTLLPLTGMAAVVQLQPQALELSSAEATLAGGRVSLDPMRVPLQRGATISGVAHARDVQVAPLLDAVNLSRALKLDAVVGGVLPFSLGPAGLRFTGGELKAQGPGRLSLVRSALTGVAAGGGPASATPSAAQDFAFQALEDLAFTDLAARVDSQPGGRLGVLFHIKGRHDPPVGRPARVRLWDLLRGRAFDKAIPLPKGTGVDLTLDTSLNFDDLYKAYLGLGRAPAASAAGSAGVQP